MRGERPIHKAVIRIQQREHAAVFLEEVDEETHGFLLHVAAQTEEGGEVSLALFIERPDIAHMQPLAAELRGQAADPGIPQHAICLRCQRITEFAGSGELAELAVRCRGPEEVTQARGEFPIIHRTGLWARSGLFTAIEKRRSHEHAGDHHAHGGGVRHFLFAELLIKGAEFILLSLAQGPAPGLGGKIESGLHLPGFGLDELLFKGFSSALDRSAHRLKGAGLGILRGELIELLKHIHLLQG